MVTGFQSEYLVDMDALRGEGAAGILLKPFDVETFLDEVRRILATTPAPARRPLASL
jgi:hypothetical protein